MKNLLDELRIEDSRKPLAGGKPGKAVRARYGLLLLIAIACGAAAWAWRATRQKPSKVEVITVAPVSQAGDSRATLTAGGYVKDPTIVYVVPRIAGRIDAVFVKEGDAVRAGDLLARLDTRDLVKAEEETRANLLAAQSTLNKLRAGNRPEEIAEMKAKAAAAFHSRDNSAKELARGRDLLAGGLISAQEFDRLQAQYLIAEKTAAAISHALALLEAGTRREEIEAAEAAAAASRARLEPAADRLSYAEVRAPISGRVLRRYREPGDHVSPDVPFVQAYDTVAVGSPVVAIAALEDQEISADINETDLPKVTLGQQVEVRPNAFPDERFTGRVIRVAPRADKNKNTIEVRARLDRGARRLPHEMSVKLSFTEGPAAGKREAPDVLPGATNLKDGSPVPSR